LGKVAGEGAGSSEESNVLEGRPTKKSKNPRKKNGVGTTSSAMNSALFLQRSKGLGGGGVKSLGKIVRRGRQKGETGLGSVGTLSEGGGGKQSLMESRSSK